MLAPINNEYLSSNFIKAIFLFSIKNNFFLIRDPAGTP